MADQDILELEAKLFRRIIDKYHAVCVGTSYTWEVRAGQILTFVSGVRNEYIKELESEGE